MKKLLKIIIISDVLIIIWAVVSRQIFLDRPVILLLVSVVWYGILNEKFMKFIKKNSPLILILIGSFLVRFLGIFYPEHYGLVEQEVYTLPIVAVYSENWLEAFRQFTSFETLGLFIQSSFFYLTTYFNFQWFINFFHFLLPQYYYFLNIPSPDINNWPSWSPDGTYGGLSTHLVDRYALNYFFIRLVSAIMGTTTVLLVYLSAKNLFDKKTALFSSLILSLTFLHVVMSMIGRQYIIATFFITLVFFFCSSIIKQGKFIYYLFAGVSVGLTNAAKIFPASIMLLGIAFLVDCFYNRTKSESLSKKFLGKIPFFITSIITALVTFLISSPGLFFYPEQFFNQVTRVLKTVSDNWWGLNYYSAEAGFPNWLWWIKFMMESGLYFPLFFATVFGVIICLYKAIRYFKKEEILLLSAIFPYLYLLNIAPIRREEFILFITPFFAIFAGIFIVQALDLVKNLNHKNANSKNLIAAGILIFFIGIPAGRILLFDYSINTSDNRTKVAQWVNQNIEEGNYIYLISPYTRKIKLSRDKYLISGEDLLQQNFDYYRATGVDYFVVPAIRDLGQFVYHPQEYQNIFNNLQLLKYSQLEKEFYKPFFKHGFFSPVITLGDLVNEHFDAPLQLYQLKKDNIQVVPSLKMNADFIQNPPPVIYRTIDNFKKVDDEKSQSGQSFFANRKSSQLTIAPFLGRGKYQIKIRLKTDKAAKDEALALIQFGSDIGKKDYGIYKINQEDLLTQDEYQELIYSIDLPKASRLSLDLTSLSDNYLYLDFIDIQRFQ